MAKPRWFIHAKRMEPPDCSPPEPDYNPPEPDYGDLNESYYRDGGDLSLFLRDHPRFDPGFDMVWTDMRRQALTRSMRELADADGEPLIRVRRVPIAGVPLHVHSLDHGHDDDAFARGIERLGPLAFSLLRGQILVSKHLARRLADLLRYYEDLVFGVVGARESGVADFDWFYREQAHLVMWDGIGLLHRVIEQMAVLFDALHAAPADLGERLVRSEVLAWKIVQSPNFVSRSNWRRLLGIPVPRRVNQKLTAEQAAVARSVHSLTEDLVLEDVRLLRQVWTKDLHRVATRFKHSAPALNLSFGVVWVGDDDGTREEIRRLAKNGALTFADATESGSLEELVVPATIGSIEIVFGAIAAAHRVAQVLVHSVLDPAESANGSALAVHPSIHLPELISLQELGRLLADYTGSPEFADAVTPAIGKATSQNTIEEAGARLRRELDARADALRSEGQ